MFISTLKFLRCPARIRQAHCGNELTLRAPVYLNPHEVQYGTLLCEKCSRKFPLLAGVAILVPNVKSYVIEHVKGISRSVPDQSIPKEFLKDYLKAKSEIQVEHIEEDLEAQRVTSLYVMNHYLKVSEYLDKKDHAWWKSTSSTSPLLSSLIEQYWDEGPFAQILRWMKENQTNKKMNSKPKIVELGCGVGGLFPVLYEQLDQYLGIDSSFSSIVLARHLALGVPYSDPIKYPGDLLQGTVSRVLPHIKPCKFQGISADFIVGDLENPPIVQKIWDGAIALNAIDMLADPTVLPRIKRKLLKENGFSIQSCPYVWHESVSKKLRKLLPRNISDSSRAVEWLYAQEAFQVEKTVEHLPWLFFKHLRQLEIYSVHLFFSRLKTHNKNQWPQMR